MQAKQAIVHGKLTCRANGATVVKQQFGRADIKLRKADGRTIRFRQRFKGSEQPMH
jgi:hypothetical protein